MNTAPAAARAREIVAAATKDPARGMSAEEARILETAPDRTLMMEKLLLVHYHRTGKTDALVGQAEKIFAAEKSGENAKNLALARRAQGRAPEAVALLAEHRDLFDPIVWNDLMCMMQGALGDTAAAVRHGTESLRLKDAAAPKAPELTPRLAPFDIEKPRSNVIAFSLWGHDRRYIDGAIFNSIVTRYLYPGWSVRIYHDDSLPEDARRTLLAQGAALVRAPEDMPAARYGLFWRFLVEDDPAVDRYLVRDADSVMNIKERAAVEDWLASNRAFHVMRDLPTHSELILAGMWGAVRGNIGEMRQRIEAHLGAQNRVLNNVTTDQVFLRNTIWPIVRQDVLVHDAHFEFGEPRRYREEFHLPRRYHIGQNDWVHRRPAKTSG
jgi:hypothetical protein